MLVALENQNQTRQVPLLKVVKADGFSWTTLFSMLEVCLLKNTADFIYYLSYTIAMNSFDIVSRLTITNLSCDFATLKNLLS